MKKLEATFKDDKIATKNFLLRNNKLYSFKKLRLDLMQLEKFFKSKM